MHEVCWAMMSCKESGWVCTYRREEMIEQYVFGFDVAVDDVLLGKKKKSKIGPTSGEYLREICLCATINLLLDSKCLANV